MLTANNIITVTKGFKKELKKIHSKKIDIVYNGWDKEMSQLNFGEETYYDFEYIYYGGTLYKHRLPSLYLLIDSIKEISAKNNIKLILRSCGPKHLEKEVQRYIRKEKLENIVIIKPKCSNKLAYVEMRNAKINVVLSDLDERKAYLLSTLPAKLFELLAIDVPILAIASPKSEINEVLKYTNKGIISNNKKEIEKYVLNNSKNAKGNMKSILKYSRKYQARKLCRILDINTESSKR